MDTILNSHLIPAATLRANDFSAFYQFRKQSMLSLIEKAMGKIAAPNSVDDTDNGDDSELGIEGWSKPIVIVRHCHFNVGAL